jgi:uncharacterized protein (TIGR02996 family)
MHPDAKAFEDAMLADPFDRTTQLVYADWCDEHGDAEYAAALRRDNFSGHIPVARILRLTPREAWQTVKAVGGMAEQLQAVARRFIDFGKWIA